MERLRIAICDDEPEAISTIHSYLLKMLAEQIDGVDFFFFRDGAALIENCPERLDLVFLDIVMDSVDGMTAARKLRERDEKVQIVFITNMPQFAIDGYKVHAFGYLLKPLSYDDFRLQLWELLERIAAEKRSGLLIKNGVSSLCVRFGDIRYIEASNRKLYIHTVSGTYEYKSTIRDLEKPLRLHGFVRCHHAFLVNTACISACSRNELTLSNGQKIPVSRKKYSDCMVFLNRYIGAKL